MKSNKVYEEKVERKKRLEKEILDCIDSVYVFKDNAIHNTIRIKDIDIAKYKFT